MSKLHTPYRLGFVPKTLIVPEELKNYLMVYFDQDSNLQFTTNVDDVSKIIGMAKLLDFAIQNSFLDIEVKEK